MSADENCLKISDGDTPAADPDASARRLLREAEVADFFQRTRRTLYNWERAGLLQPIRIGRSKFYRPADIERLAGGDDQVTDRASRADSESGAVDTPADFRPDHRDPA